MAIHERNRAVTVYHSIVAILLLLAGGALVGTGIWLRTTDYVGPVNLEYTGSNVFNWVLNFTIALILIGCFLLVAAVASLLSLARKCIGVTFRIIYVIMALIITAALVFIVAVSILILVNRNTDPVRNFISDAWERTVDSDPLAICGIERELGCRGFNDNDCVSCELGTEDNCPNRNFCAECGLRTDVSVGCYDEIVGSIRAYYLPVAIVGSFLALIVLIDIFVTCAL